MVKARNVMAKALGYVDYYDYKVTQAEGFNKARLFEILGDQFTVLGFSGTKVQILTLP